MNYHVKGVCVCVSLRQHVYNGILHYIVLSFIVTILQYTSIPSVVQFACCVCSVALRWLIGLSSINTIYHRLVFWILGFAIFRNPDYGITPLHCGIGTVASLGRRTCYLYIG